MKTPAGLAQLIVTGTTAFGHHCGTCRMGIDDAAIVDESLQVRGTKGLFVVDASIIPEIPSIPTNALVSAHGRISCEQIDEELRRRR